MKFLPPLDQIQQLHGLEKLSPKFPNRLTRHLRGKGYKEYVSNLQGKDSTSLVEYLDSVRLISFSVFFLLPQPPPRFSTFFNLIARPFGYVCGNSEKFAVISGYFPLPTSFHLVS